jgi:hypothetical protein
VKLSRRGPSADTDPEIVAETEVEEFDHNPDATAPKGRPTPKRRDAEGRKGPVSAPKTRKEAYARQKQLTKEQRASKAVNMTKGGGSKAGSKPTSAAEQRAALKRGDVTALPRRDQGQTKKLARDYVDSRRMLSNYLLWLFPVFVLTSFVHALRFAQAGVIVIFLGLVVEWFLVGRRLRALAISRFGSADGSAMGIGFYMGSRAYLPRRWRLPAPQLQRGDDF